jgi:hypothetical protein
MTTLNMTRITMLLLALLIFNGCNNNTSKENTILIPIDAKNVTVVNQTDENGKKQGQWQELDTINQRIAKEFYYKDDLLDSSYLVYKHDSADSLILGNYKLGKKNGEWKYWDMNSNRLDRIELYENDALKETKKY